MGIRSWFGNEAAREPEQPERRIDARLSVHAEVFIDDRNEPGAAGLKQANLVDFASGGIRFLVDAAVEVGQTVWVRTRVTHVSRTALGAEMGVTWDANSSPLSGSTAQEGSSEFSDGRSGPLISEAIAGRS